MSARPGSGTEGEKLFQLPGPGNIQHAGDESRRGQDW